MITRCNIHKRIFFICHGCWQLWLSTISGLLLLKVTFALLLSLFVLSLPPIYPNSSSGLPLLLLLSICLVSIKFFKPCFLIMCYRIFSCLFLIVNSCFLVVAILLKTSLLHTCSVHGILRIHKLNHHISVTSSIFFISEKTWNIAVKTMMMRIRVWLIWGDDDNASIKNIWQI